jgi:hypothetical protein
MRGKVIFVVGLATGYVLGTRAGRKRYEQIRSGAQKVWNTPLVQKGVDAAEGFAAARVDQLKDAAGDAAKKALGSLLGKEPLTEPSQSTSRSTASATPTTSAPRSASKPKATPKGGTTPPVEPLTPSTDI